MPKSKSDRFELADAGGDEGDSMWTEEGEFVRPSGMSTAVTTLFLVSTMAGGGIVSFGENTLEIYYSKTFSDCASSRNSIRNILDWAANERAYGDYCHANGRLFGSMLDDFAQAIS